MEIARYLELSAPTSVSFLNSEKQSQHFLKFLTHPLLIQVLLRYSFRPIGLLVRVFTNGQGNRGLILGRVIPKTRKMVLDAALTLSIIRYGSRERSSTPPYTSVKQLLKMVPLGRPRLRSPALLTN